MEVAEMDKANVIRGYVRDVKHGYNFATLEEIALDCQEDEQLIRNEITTNDIVKYALDNGWKIYDDSNEGWSITPN